MKLMPWIYSLAYSQYQMMSFECAFFYLFFLIEALLVTVWYAETSGVENVCNLEAAENALNLSPTGTLQMKEHISSYCIFSTT